MTSRTCPKCGAEVTIGERFCGNCGARQPDDAPATGPTQMLGSLPSSSPAPTFPSEQKSQPTAPPPASSSTIPSYDASAVAPPKRSGCPLWLIILLSVVGLCMVMAVAGIGILTLLGQRVSSVFSEINSGLLVEVPEGTLTPFDDIQATAEAVATSQVATAETVLNDSTQDIAATVEAARTIVSGQGDEVIAGAQATAAALATEAAGLQGDLQATAAAVATEAAGLQGDLQATAEAVASGATALQATAEAQALFAVARQVFRDEFVDNRNNWFTGRFNEQETNEIADGVFKVTWEKQGFSYEVYEVREFTNFIAQVDCVVVAGGTDGSCGIVFAQVPDVGQYEFEVFDDYYRLSVNFNGEWQTLLEGDPTEIVKPGESNRLQVVRSNGEIRLVLNDQLLDRSDDTTLTTGKIGVSTNCYNENGGVEVWFDNFTIWELPS